MRNCIGDWLSWSPTNNRSLWLFADVSLPSPYVCALCLEAPSTTRTFHITPSIKAGYRAPLVDSLKKVYDLNFNFKAVVQGLGSGAYWILSLR